MESYRRNPGEYDSERFTLRVEWRSIRSAECRQVKLVANWAAQLRADREDVKVTKTGNRGPFDRRFRNVGIDLWDALTRLSEETQTYGPIESRPVRELAEVILEAKPYSR